MSPVEDSLSNTLHTASFLVLSQPNETSSNLKDILVKRLTRYYTQIGDEDALLFLDHSSPDEVQLKTAEEALNVISRIQKILIEDSGNAQIDNVSRSTDGSYQAIGSRDLGQIRTLISIVFKWGILPLLSRVSSTWQTSSSHLGATIIDLTNTPEDYEILSRSISQVLSLLFPDGIHASLSSTLICAIVIERHLVDLLVVCLTIGWLPKSLSSESTPTIDRIRPYIMRLLALMPPSRAIEGLGSVLAFKPTPPRHAIKVCGSLLSRQLLRRDGVRALFIALFTGEELSGESAPLDKLEQTARILCSVPAQTNPEDYFSNIGTQIVDIFVQDATPPLYIQASAFFLSQMLERDGTSDQALFVNTVLPVLHHPFVGPLVAAEEIGSVPLTLTPLRATAALVKIVANMNPSPTVLTKVLSPIIPSLYAILESFEAKKTSDPEIKEAVRNLLRTWGRVAGTSEALDVLWSIVSDKGGRWKIDLDGEIRRTDDSDESSSLSLLTPADINSLEKDGDVDIDINLFGLQPDPSVFISFLESIDRTDITSDLFIRLLDAYQQSKSTEDDDPMRTLLYLQLINRMQSQISTSTSNRILNNHDQALAFVKHALEATVSKKKTKPNPSQDSALTLEDLRIISDDENDTSDETLEPSSDEEMTVTAINLLLSLLEGNDNLSAKTTPALNDIFSLLEGLAISESDNIRRLASEARLTMTARLASTSGDMQSKKRADRNGEEGPKETYQTALKLLQDPLLPVRAHGLLLLRQLVSPRRSKDDKSALPPVDRALIPAILDIFFQALRDDDSYIFLNGVQGLSVMVDGFGKEVLQGLLKVYSNGLDGIAAGNLTQYDVDVRTRVGEALNQVIQRCGEALPDYASLLVPPLFQVVRNTSLPTVIRTSALSLLATCTKTSALALLPYLEDLCSSMVDLLQLESKAAVVRVPGLMDETGEDDKLCETMDSSPTSKQSKLPPFRRAALLFLSLILKACTERVYELGTESLFPSALANRTRNTLRYVASTDEDGVVRVMARETLELFDSLVEAMINI